MNTATGTIEICAAERRSQVEALQGLFMEYAQSLGHKPCFQSFKNEVSGLPSPYAGPRGLLLLALCDGERTGCVAMRELFPLIAEMKRLYVRPQYRDQSLGQTLARRIIDEARELGQRKICLNTIESLMPIAVAIYRAMGFVEIAPYDSHPVEGAMYMELLL